MHRQIGAQHKAGAPPTLQTPLVLLSIRPRRIAAMPMNGAAFTHFPSGLARSLLNRLH